MLGCNISGTARITSQGIHFLNLYYSCNRAISEQWYVKARLYGDTEIQVKYNLEDLSKILIKSEESQDGFELGHLLIPEKISDTKLEKYFQSMQELKSIKKSKERQG